jgi:predicted neutral ceramidase superfamily lipid hydrolase
MNEIDKEIVSILRDLFRKKNDVLYDPDDLLREMIVKQSVYTGLIAVVVLVPMKVLGFEYHEAADSIVSVLVAIAFTFMFLHINNKSKHPSLIMFGLTWLSLVTSLYFANI